jgi:hypothetical protein
MARCRAVRCSRCGHTRSVFVQRVAQDAAGRCERPVSAAPKRRRDRQGPRRLPCDRAPPPGGARPSQPAHVMCVTCGWYASGQHAAAESCTMVVAFTFAPSATSSQRASTRPFSAAMCSGIHPDCAAEASKQQSRGTRHLPPSEARAPRARVRTQTHIALGVDVAPEPDKLAHGQSMPGLCCAMQCAAATLAGGVKARSAPQTTNRKSSRGSACAHVACHGASALKRLRGRSGL